MSRKNDYNSHMNDINKRFGINVKKWCREHESDVSKKLAETNDAEKLRALLAYHEKRLSWLMHERLIHLIVLFITVILVLFSMSLILFLPDTLAFTLPMFIILKPKTWRR